MESIDTARLERVVGRLEGAVTALQEDRLRRETDCQRHWVITNGLVQELANQKAMQSAITTAAERARQTIAEAAETARQTLAGAALERKQQRHWMIERTLQVLPMAGPFAAALVGYLAGRGVI